MEGEESDDEEMRAGLEMAEDLAMSDTLDSQQGSRNNDDETPGSDQFYRFILGTTQTGTIDATRLASPPWRIETNNSGMTSGELGRRYFSPLIQPRSTLFSPRPRPRPFSFAIPSTGLNKEDESRVSIDIAGLSFGIAGSEAEGRLYVGTSSRLFEFSGWLGAEIDGPKADSLFKMRRWLPNLGRVGGDDGMI